MERKPQIIQIINLGQTIVGLAKDGALYRFDQQVRKWVPMEEE